MWCEEPSHDHTYIGRLESRRIGPYETWIPLGPHVTTQTLATPQEAGVKPEVLSLLGRFAMRHRLLCPVCGLDVLGGDRLGTRPGYRSIWESRGQDPGELDPQAHSAAEKTDVLLSKVADSGVSRLSLSAVGRILSL